MGCKAILNGRIQKTASERLTRGDGAKEVSWQSTDVPPASRPHACPGEHPILSQECRSVLLMLACRERSPLAPLHASAALSVTWLSSSCLDLPSEPMGIGAAVGPVTEIVEDRAASLLASVW